MKHKTVFFFPLFLNIYAFTQCSQMRNHISLTTSSDLKLIFLIKNKKHLINSKNQNTVSNQNPLLLIFSVSTILHP